MPTLRDAASLLARATTVARSEPLAQALGFGGWLPFPSNVSAATGIDGIVDDARIATGLGQLRALGGRSSTPNAGHDALRAVTRMATHAPEALWVAILVEIGRAHV